MDRDQLRRPPRTLTLEQRERERQRTLDMILLCATRQDCDPFQYTVIPSTGCTSEQFISTAPSLGVSDPGYPGATNDTSPMISG